MVKQVRETMTIYDITQINRIKKYIIKLKWLKKVFLAFFE